MLLANGDDMVVLLLLMNVKGEMRKELVLVDQCL